MFFGFDDSLKELKKEWKEAGVDMGYVREWQKLYDKVKKQAPQLETQYTQVKNDLKRVYTCLQDMEQLLISSKSDLRNSEVRKSLVDMAKELKKCQNAFNHEFLISKEDKDFHSTYASILTLCGKNITEQKEALILQSEVENLLSLTKEALEKKWPSFCAMAYYYIDRTDKDIFDLPHSDKIEKVNRIYANEFYNPIQQVLLNHLNETRVKEILEVELCLN